MQSVFQLRPRLIIRLSLAEQCSSTEPGNAFGSRTLGHRNSLLCSLFLHELKVDLGLENQIKFILLLARKNLPLLAQEAVDICESGISALKESVDDSHAIGSYRLISEADPVTRHAIDENLAFRRQCLAQIKFLA